MKTKIAFQIEYRICYRNISQITISPGLIVICEIDPFLRFSADFFLFQAPWHEAAPLKTKIAFQLEYKICYRNISQITIRPRLVVICGIAQLCYFAISLFRNFANYNKPYIYAISTAFLSLRLPEINRLHDNYQNASSLRTPGSYSKLSILNTNPNSIY